MFCLLCYSISLIYADGFVKVCFVTVYPSNMQMGMFCFVTVYT